MSVATAALLGGGVAGAVALVATPVAIRVAGRTGFLDRPRQYRKHAAPTPFLGGAAVLLAFIVAAAAVGASVHFRVLIICAAALWVVGTVDDRFSVSPGLRLLAETVAAGALYVDGLGWRLSGYGIVDLLLTVIWCIGLVNAFNLMDNMDGACGTVGCVSALGIGALAAVHGDPLRAGMAFALAAACAGFLYFNLAGPARIFLGDGGSMPIGFLIAGLGMATGRELGLGGAALPAIALTVGVVILDTTLVSVSRTRRRVSLLTGGRDHLTHRLHGRLGSPRRVAAALALLQGGLCGLAILGGGLGIVAVVAIAATVLGVGVLTIVELDSVRWRPAGIAVGPPALPAAPRTADLESVPAESA